MIPVLETSLFHAVARSLDQGRCIRVVVPSVRKAVEALSSHGANSTVRSFGDDRRADCFGIGFHVTLIVGDSSKLLTHLARLRQRVTAPQTA